MPKRNIEEKVSGAGEPILVAVRAEEGRVRPRGLQERLHVPAQVEQCSDDPGISRWGPPPNSGRILQKIEGGGVGHSDSFWGTPFVDLA